MTTAQPLTQPLAQNVERRSMSAMAGFEPRHFLWRVEGAVAVIRLNRPDRKNPLTFESYAELRDTFRALPYAGDINAVVFLPNGGHFCSGGDVHDIIGPLMAMEMKELLIFTRMTGDLVKAILHCGKPVIAAVDGVAVGAGAIIAMASDIRMATPQAKTTFLFNRVGLAGCDMGACAMLPRIIGQGRAAELLYTGRTMTAREGELWGFFNKVVEAEALEQEALTLAQQIASGPTFANGITKTQLNQEWSMSLDQAIEAEAQAQAICMQTRDFERAYRAFVAKQKPVFEGD
jgi:enoyl-CoA hydratase/carnithine racemase